MAITLIATYENGILRLPGSLNLPEHTRVKVQIESLAEGQAPIGDLVQQVLTLTEERAPFKPTFSKEEQSHRLSIVRQLYGIWSEEDEAAFERKRKELWARWQPHSFA
jgi:predicted DNA-binding antitoxin AbrB/MazE fold protein